MAEIICESSPKVKRTGHIALLITFTIFGLNTAVAKDVMEHQIVSPFTLSVLRMVGAAILFWIASLFAPKEKVKSSDFIKLFYAGMLGVLINQGLYIQGLSQTSPVDAMVVSTMAPMITMILAALFLREPITEKKVIGVLIGAAGALLLIFAGEAALSGSSEKSHLIGNITCFLAVTSYACYLTLFRSLITKYHPVTIMKWMFTYASMAIIPFSYDDLSTIEVSKIPIPYLIEVLSVIVLATFVTYILLPVGQKRLRPTVISMYNYVQLCVATIAAVLMGYDTLSVYKVLAVILVVIGVYFVTQSKSKAQIEAETLKTGLNEPTDKTQV